MAVEELLRAYAPVTMARIVAQDVELQGRQLKAGDWVLLPFPAANRDPEMFDDADRVILDRAVNRHSAFGLGIHRCLGSNLARMELKVAVQEWMAVPGLRAWPTLEAVTWSAGQVRGPRRAGAHPRSFPTDCRSGRPRRGARHRRGSGSRGLGLAAADGGHPQVELLEHG